LNGVLAGWLDLPPFGWRSPSCLEAAASYSPGISLGGRISHPAQVDQVQSRIKTAALPVRADQSHAVRMPFTSMPVIYLVTLARRGVGVSYRHFT